MLNSWVKPATFNVERDEIVLVCGSRSYSRFDTIFKALKRTGPFYIVQGAAPGADTHAKHAALMLGIPFKEYKAEWERFGKAAGFMRNTRMLEDNPQITQVWAFVTRGKLYDSRGTLDMVGQALQRGLPVRLYDESKWLRWKSLYWFEGRVEIGLGNRTALLAIQPLEVRRKPSRPYRWRPTVKLVGGKLVPLTEEEKEEWL